MVQIFDEIKSRGAGEVFFIAMDRVLGLEDRGKAILPQVIVQCCIVNLIPNLIKYVPCKDYKRNIKDVSNFKFTRPRLLLITRSSVAILGTPK